MLILPQTKGKNSLLNSYLNKCNVKPVFRNTNTIQKYVRNKTSSDEKRPCIYEIPCQGCNKTYIGESIDFDRRKRQRRDSLLRGDENSALFQHRQNNDHVINLDDMRAMIYINDVDKRRLLESILIQNVEAINVYKSNLKLDIFFNSIMTKHVTSVNKLLSSLRKPP